MAKRTEEENKTPGPSASPFSKMLTLDEVQEILNLGKPMVYALVKNGELRAAQFGGRGVWRIRQDDLAAYIDAAYEKTAERIASGQIPDGNTTVDS